MQFYFFKVRHVGEKQRELSTYLGVAGVFPFSRFCDLTGLAGSYRKTDTPIVISAIDLVGVGEVSFFRGVPL